MQRIYLRRIHTHTHTERERERERERDVVLKRAKRYI